MARRLLLAGVAGLVALVATAAVLWPTTAAPAYPVTPPMLTYQADGADAAELLRRLADRAENAPVLGVGRYTYVRLHSYHLDTAVGAEGSTSAFRVVREERWLAPDGSGRAVDTEGQTAVVRAGNADTVGAVTYRDGAQRDERYGPGQLSGVANLAALSIDPAVLAGQLAADRTQFGWGETAPNAPDWYRRIAVVSAIGQQQAIAGRLWAAMLRVIATTPQMMSLGRITDRTGRAAVAFGVDTTEGGGRPNRLVLWLDPDTGTLLGGEEILTTKHGDGPYDAYLNVPIPAVVSFRAVLTVAKAATDEDRPTSVGHR